MMGIRTIYYATQFGAIDSDAAEDGGPYSAHLLRTIGRNSNHLLRKGHMLINLVWPMAGDRNVDGDGDTFGQRLEGTSTEGQIYPFWTQKVRPVCVSKKPGLTEASVRITAKIGGTDRVYFRVCTRATGDATTPNNGNIVEATGDGSGTAQTFSIASVPMDSGPEEVVSLWARSSSLTTPSLGATGTYGFPNSGSFGTATGNAIPSRTTIKILKAHYTGGTPAWVTSSTDHSTTYAKNHDLWLYSDQGGLVASPRRIMEVYDDSDYATMRIPGLWTQQVDALDGGTFEIREATGPAGFELFGLAMAATGRDI